MKVISDSLIKVPNIGFILCNVDDNIVDRSLDSYIYKKNNSYYIVFLTNKYNDMEQKEILFNTRRIFEGANHVA